MLFNNYPLVAALAAILISQILKIPIAMALRRSPSIGLLFATGGMPSSHSAGVASLVTALIVVEGWQSHLTAIAITFAVIVIFDSMGVRRQSGEHSILINELLEDFKSLRESLAKVNQDGKLDLATVEKHSRQMLGHKPIEVFFGVIAGILISLILYFIFYQ